jgi:CRP-like cAMP-binding protein/integrase
MPCEIAFTVESGGDPGYIYGAVPSVQVIQVSPIGLLACMSPGESREVLSTANQLSFASNEELFLEGHPANCLILIESGRVKLSRIGYDGRETILRTCGSGEIVGAYFESGYSRHTCTARAMTHCRVLIWDSSQAFALGIRYPQIRTNLIRILANRLDELEERVCQIASGKLATEKTSQPDLNTQLSLRTSDDSYLHHGDHNGVASMSLSEFVRRRFIPEFVENKRSAGRAHFREILKFIVHSDEGPHACADTSERRPTKRNAIASWPYMDSLRLSDINEETVQHITSTALASGYSPQTAKHIRNVICAIYSHAIKACCYKGSNPAALVPLPAVVQSDEHVLTLVQLKEVMALMRFPESTIALLALLTEMNMVEISGLQWQWVNLSDNAQLVGEDWIPAKTIAVRNQWYRGEFRPVMKNRRRVVSMPEFLCSILRDMRSRNHFTGPQDFVVASRSGSPVYPGNIAKRRLKSIGQSCDMPWLSWHVFSRTHLRLKSEFGRHLHKEYAKVLRHQCW